MAVNGLKEATEENVRSIRVELAKIDVLVSANPNSPRNVKLRELIVSPTRYEIFDVVGELSDLADEEADDLTAELEAEPIRVVRADTVAVIIWVGTQLNSFQIERLRNEYAQLGGNEQHGPTEPLSRVLYDRVKLDDEPSVNEQFKGFMGGVNAVHQALDQELRHAEETDRCLQVLEGIAGQVLVYRPPNGCFIRFDMQQIPNSWLAYGRMENDPLIAPLDFSKKIILVTIGHGDPYGRTSFPSRGPRSQPEIADLLGPHSRQPTVYRIPLQCYPQKAVSTWPGSGGAASINNPGKSDDNEMKIWIRDELENSVRQWLAKF